MPSPSKPLSAFMSDSSKLPTIETVAKLLASDQIKNVVVLAGAGISTASGIPDFRSPDTGLYANLAKYSLPYPEAIFEISYFQSKPQPFFTLSKELYPGNFQPTLTHYFFKLLNEKGKLLRVFTQNIDTLERLAGLPADRIVEAHGSFATSRCIRCKKKVAEEWMKEKCMKGEVAYCPDSTCRQRTDGGKGGLVKPDIVFFGEGLPDRFFTQLSDLSKADLLITLGTSLQVQPFASLIDRVNPTCPRLLINLERVGDIGGEDVYSPSDSDGYSRGGMFSMFRETGFDFFGRGLRDKSKIRDVFFKGKTDEGIAILAKECGWQDELQELYESEKRKFLKESGQEKKDAQEEAQAIAAEVAEDEKKAGKPSESSKVEIEAHIEGKKATPEDSKSESITQSPSADTVSKASAEKSKDTSGDLSEQVNKLSVTDEKTDDTVNKL
ncbi:unnamed protein product [Sympodiomycopsis kandeliae]